MSAGTTLSGYRDGETVITTDKTLIEGKRIDCHVAIRAHGAVVRNSKINGTRNRPEETTYSSHPFVAIDLFADCQIVLQMYVPQAAGWFGT